MKTDHAKMLFLLLIFPILGSFIISCTMYYRVETVDFPTANASLSEGKKLTMSICGPCHYNPATKKFDGKRMLDVPGFVGEVYASNITRDRQYGIGEYSRDELAYLVRTGLSRKGKIMPYMIRPNLADQDLQSIIAYLQSGDDLVSPSAVIPGETRYSALGKVGMSMTKPFSYGTSKTTRPEGNAIELGRYLVDNLACFHCHSGSFASLDLERPENSKGYMGGGNTFRDASGNRIKSPNITFDVSGISDWTVEDFKRALREGITKRKGVLTYPMPLYPELSDQEVASIYLYLKSVPTIKNYR